MALKRTMGLWGLVFYGTGTILGAGIFVVIGEVMDEAGPLAPFAYLLAGIVAFTTALSFAEMGARVPSAGGPIDYSDEAFGGTFLPAFSGYAIITANTVSAATITTGFVSYLSSFVTVPHWAMVVGLLLIVGAVAIAGMKQAAWFMTVTTVIGLLTLAAIVWLSRETLMAWPGSLTAGRGDGLLGSGRDWSAIVAGGFLAIYSFIGFGDMAETAEELKDPKKTLPKAIVITMIVVSVAYLVISATLAGHESTREIAEADAPLVRAAVSVSGFPALPLAIASLFVIVNGALTQIVAASRLLMDMARDGRPCAPQWFAHIHPRTNTPVKSTVLLVVLVTVLALFVPLKTLASGTSLVILVVFAIVNASLWKLKTREQPDDVPNVWPILPRLGLFLCVLTVAGQIVLWALGAGAA